MVSVETQIAEWRRYVANAPALNGHDVDELEDHLRHQMAELSAAGLEEDEAFLVAASATPLVLAILAEGESYGYAILKRVRALSEGELEWSDGMLYPLLHRLGRLGYVTTEWRTPPEGRRRRYYVITDEGRAALAEHRRQWLAVTRALNDAWPGSGALLTTLGEA